MNDREAKIAELKTLFPAAKKPRALRRKPVAAGNTIIVNGDGVAAHQIAGGDIHNHSYAKAPPRPRVVVTPGVGVIDESQKVAITAARAEWIAVHNSIKQAPLSDKAAWSRINKAAGVTSYHLIPAERFALVMAYIQQQVAMLRNMKSAPAKDDRWRSAKIGAIKARAIKQFGDANLYKPYIRKNFGLDSLTALSTDQLRRTYAWIMGKTVPPASA